MKEVLLTGLLLAFLFLPFCAAAENVTVYVVPAISDNKILPKSSIPFSHISDTVSIKASPSEFESSSFVVQANQNINNMTIKTNDLIGSKGIIPKKNVDIRIVKCWYQGGYSDGSLTVSGKYLTPELLLKDDSLIKVTGDNCTKWDSSDPKGKNYLKLTNGSYIDISNSSPLYSDSLIIPISSRPIRDATTLQPVNIQKGCNKQFWITLHVPKNANPGNYRGTIILKTGSKIIRQLHINLQVLPIILSEPNIEYSVYYRGKITDQGSISSEYKTKAQFSAENKDMLIHGISNPTVYPTSTDNILKRVLSIRNKIGLNNANLYYLGLGINSESEFSYYKNLTAPYGVTNIYAYCPDEQNLNDTESRTKITAIHKAGGKVMDAQSISQADSVADILDLAVVSSNPSAELANKYHNYNHKVYSYGNPQVVPEYPRLFRMNYGLLLWQRDYDGAMDYAYQHSFGDIWNDFDHTYYRDHVFAYPTMDGVIDTIQWEGFREGVDDMRYLATLQNTIKSAKRLGKDTSAAENYLAHLKKSDLSSQDLDAVRGQMMNYILSLQKAKFNQHINRVRT